MALAVDVVEAGEDVTSEVGLRVGGQEEQVRFPCAWVGIFCRENPLSDVAVGHDPSDDGDELDLESERRHVGKPTQREVFAEVLGRLGGLVQRLRQLPRLVAGTQNCSHGHNLRGVEGDCEKVPGVAIRVELVVSDQLD